MRNRDQPAGAYAGQHAGDGSDIGASGLTKREDAAIAIRASLEASPHGAPLVTTPSGEERRMSRAEYAVQEADALFDVLDVERPPEVDGVGIRAKAANEANAYALKFLRDAGHDKAADALEADLEIPF